jgi:hypothetical protein
VSAIPCDFGKVSPKFSPCCKNLECVHVSSTKRKTKSNNKGRLKNTLKRGKTHILVNGTNSKIKTLYKEEIRDHFIFGDYLPP